nr:MAG TPA: hypothetical protein [Caudoviricetes sp.]
MKTQRFLYAHLQHFTPACEFKSSLPRQAKQEKTLRFPLLFLLYRLVLLRKVQFLHFRKCLYP